MVDIYGRAYKKMTRRGQSLRVLGKLHGTYRTTEEKQGEREP